MNFPRPSWVPSEVTNDQWHDFNICLMWTLGICLMVLLLFVNSCRASPFCSI